MFLWVLSDHAEKQKLIDDAMFKLEHGEKDKRKSKAAIPGLVQIKVSDVVLITAYVQYMDQ